MISDTRADQLPAEHTDHIRRVHSIPRLWFDSVDGGSVCDLGGLQAEVDGKRLYDRSSDGEGTRICSDDDAGQAYEFAKNDGEERHESVDDEARIDRTQAQSQNANQREKADCQRGVVVRRTRKKKGEDCPETGKSARGAEAYKACLDKNRLGLVSIRTGCNL